MRASLLTLSTLAGILALGGSASGQEAGGPNTRPEQIVEEVGDMRFQYRQSAGLDLRVFDVPVLGSSSIVVVKPGWTGTYYNSFNNMTLMDTVTVEDYEDGRRITLHHELEEEYESPFAGTKTITLRPDNSMHVRMDFIFDSDDPSMLEWRVGGFNPTLVAGLPYRVVMPDEVTEGVVAYEAEGPAATDTTVARGFEELQIQSRLGPITIESIPENNLILFDYRKNVYADEGRPMFWFGYLGRGIPGGEELTYEFTLRLPQTFEPASVAAAPVTAASGVEATGSARVPGPGRDYIIPKPKETEYTGDEVSLGPETPVYTGPDPGRGIETAVEFLVEDFEELYGINAQVVRGPAPDPPPAGAILMGEAGRYDVPVELLSEAGLEIPDHHEGYALRTGDGHTLIAANTEVGVFYGVTTLLQLVVPAEGGDGIALRGAAIVDWPSLDFRGIHALSGRDAGDQISKAVRELMARYKINSFIWECQYIVWDNAPELEHPRFGMAKDDAQKVVDAADEYFIDLIPLIQSLGHSEWIFTGGHNLDIAEDPETPYAYMVTNPRTYEFIFTIFEEALEFFEPRGFHIGHDEVTMRGRFPYRSADSGMSVTDLVLKDTKKLNNWFRERGVQVYMWGDMFLYSDEAPDATFAPSQEAATERRARLHRDITVTDWHYAPVEPDEFTSIPLWRDECFEVIGAAWHRPLNIRNLAHACINAGVKGFLQTTWAGFNFRIDDNEESWHQYWAYIMAAHYAWSGDERLPDELPFIPKEEFINTWFRTVPLLEEQEGFFVDLSEAFNRSLEDKDGSGWLGFGPENDFRSVPEGEQLLGETVFRLTRNERGEGAVMLDGMMNPEGEFPASVTLDIGGEAASGLHFLMTAAFPTREHERAGQVEIVYTDGTSEQFALDYGRNLFAFHQNRAGGDARIAWEGESGAGTPLHLWDVAWDNPNPDRPIGSLVISSTGTEAAPILLAITGVR